MDPLAVDTRAVLADLAQQYEKSNILISQIESRLKERSLTPSDVGATGREHHTEAVGSPATPEDGVPDNGDSTVKNEHSTYLSKCAARSVRFFHRKLQELKRSSSGSNDEVEVSRCVSVVDMGAVTPLRRCLPRRAASFYTSGTAALQPTSALNRRPAIEPARQQQPQQEQEEQKQQVQIGEDASASSSRNTGFGAGPATTIMLRLSSEHLPRPRQLGCAGMPKLTHQGTLRALTDIPAVQPFRRSESQLPKLQLRGSSRLQQQPLQDALMDDELMYGTNADPWNQQQQQATIDDVSKLRSTSRRGSDYISSPLGGVVLSAPTQHQQQLRQQLQQLQQPQGSPVRSGTASGCSSPAHGISSGLAVIGGSNSLRSMRRSSSNNLLMGLRSSSRTQMLPSWVTDELELWPELEEPAGDITSNSAVGFPVPTDQIFLEGDLEEKATSARTNAAAAAAVTVSAPLLQQQQGSGNPGNSLFVSSPLGAGGGAGGGGGGSQSLRVTIGALPGFRVHTSPSQTPSYSNLMPGLGPNGTASSLRSNTSFKRRL